MSAKTRYKTFGHEMYPDISLKALRLLAPLAPGVSFDRATFRDAVCEVLPQSSPSTRRAVANKILQRFLVAEEGAKIAGRQGSLLDSEPRQLTVTPFLRLVNGLHDAEARRQLLLWQLTRVETVVGGLCRHIFYPYFHQSRIPGGWEAAEFQVVNGEQLIEVERRITLTFILQFARREWGFVNRPTLLRSLRSLVQCGRIHARKLKDLWRHPQAFVPTQRPVQLAAFAFGVYQEWLPTHGQNEIPLKNLEDSRFVRTMLVSPREVSDLIRRGARYHFFQSRQMRQMISAGDTKGVMVRLTHADMEELVDAVLNLAI
ncbi:MAG: hypothetical protein HY318_05080 [Armatimonadetes bacterium]|nr:hypothetical protein [Armatimonadota bacterium]